MAEYFLAHWCEASTLPWQSGALFSALLDLAAVVQCFPHIAFACRA
jgi:hypothetical protein